MAKGKKTGGRLKGSANKVTVMAKDAIQQVFDGIGGVPAMIEWAEDDKNRGTFYGLFGRLLPVQMTGTLEITKPAIVELPPKKARD
jgi:hypothetical protein